MYSKEKSNFPFLIWLPLFLLNECHVFFCFEVFASHAPSYISTKVLINMEQKHVIDCISQLLNVFQGQLSQFCHLFGKSISNICSSVSFFCLNIKCQKVLKMFDKSSAETTLPNNWKNESQSIFKSVKQVNLHIFLYYIVFNSPKHNCVQICRISKPLNIPIYCIQLTLTQLCTKVFISSHCVHYIKHKHLNLENWTPLSSP